MPKLEVIPRPVVRDQQTRSAKRSIEIWTRLQRRVETFWRAEALMLDGVRRALDEDAFADLPDRDKPAAAGILATYESAARRRADQARDTRKALTRGAKAVALAAALLLCELPPPIYVA